MNKLIFVLLMLAGLTSMAQEEIIVNMQERPSSQGLQPAFEVEIPQATSPDAVRILERTLSPRRLFSKNQKFVQESDEWIMRGVDVKKISSSPLTVIAQVSSFPERIFVRIFLSDDLGFVGSSESMSAKADDASRFVRDYALEVYRDAVEKELRSEQNILRSLEQDLRKMGRRQSSNDRKINNLKSDNLEMRNEIRNYEMRMQRKDSFNATGESAQIVLEQHETDTKQLQKDIRSNQRKINRNERRISKFERQANRSVRDQRDILDQIDRQKIVVNEVETKLRNIR
jgi:hypothetical protein